MRGATLGACLLACLFVPAGCGSGGHEHGGAAPVALGAYDVELQQNPGGGGGGIGVVEEVDSGSADVKFTLYVAPDDRIDVTGVSVSGDSLELQAVERQSDIVRELSGSARVAQENRTSQIEGTVGNDSRQVAFTMRQDGDSAGYTGTYIFKFAASASACNCSSEASLVLDVPKSGVGTSEEARDVSAIGMILGAISAGESIVAPEGAMRLTSTYVVHDNDTGGAMGLEYPIELFGKLERESSGIRGSGQTFVSIPDGIDQPPLASVIGTWSAAKQ